MAHSFDTGVCNESLTSLFKSLSHAFIRIIIIKFSLDTCASCILPRKSIRFADICSYVFFSSLQPNTKKKETKKDQSSNASFSAIASNTRIADSSVVKQIRRMQFEAAFLRGQLGALHKENNLKMPNKH